MSRTHHIVEHPHSSLVRPDAARIAGISAAIAFNAALLMLLMRPIELAAPSPSPEVAPPITIFDRVIPKLEEVPITKPHTTVQHEQATPHVERQAVLTPTANTMSTDAVTDKNDQILPPTSTQIGPTIDTAPIEASLAYRDASPPPYPRDALRNGIEGTVQLRVLVDETGRVLDVQIVRSSGDRQLDGAAREHVLHRWLFQPAQRNGVPMRAWGIVPIEFRLDRA